jgi:DNA-binding response OmpR family regulator
MVITDLRMESDTAGQDVAAAAKKAPNRPAVAMLTAFPPADEDWVTSATDKMLVKPMNTQDLLRQIEALLISHEDKKRQEEKKKLETASMAESTARKPRKLAESRAR